MNAVTPQPKRQPQKRVEKSQPLRQRHGHRSGWSDAFSAPPAIAPASAEKKGREAAAGRPEASVVRNVLGLAGGHRV
jgi:hypothetical protein